jgi:hypothetical protein
MQASQQLCSQVALNRQMPTERAPRNQIQTLDNVWLCLSYPEGIREVCSPLGFIEEFEHPVYSKNPEQKYSD